MELKHIAAKSGRLSSILREEMQLSAGLMNRLKWKDKLFVNGIPQHTDFAVSPGDVITVPLDDPQPDYPAEDGKLSILFEDEHLLAVDKPSGMLIHPSRNRNTGTLANFVLGYYKKTGQDCAFHPITRLDRDTFGIVLLAKNSHAHALMQVTDMQKIYHALTYGGPEADAGLIDAPIARCPLPSLLRCIHPDGKPSVTEYRVLERTKILCKLELKPITGRTHQLRLHCSHMGFPILGDPQYGNPEAQSFGYTSQQLCAKALDFTHPITKEKIHLESQLDTPIPY